MYFLLCLNWSWDHLIIFLLVKDYAEALWWCLSCWCQKYTYLPHTLSYLFFSHAHVYIPPYLLSIFICLVRMKAIARWVFPCGEDERNWNNGCFCKIWYDICTWDVSVQWGWTIYARWVFLCGEGGRHIGWETYAWWVFPCNLRFYFVPNHYAIWKLVSYCSCMPFLLCGFGSWIYAEIVELRKHAYLFTYLFVYIIFVVSLHFFMFIICTVTKWVSCFSLVATSSRLGLIFTEYIGSIVLILNFGTSCADSSIGTSRVPLGT